jgi:hypothetical protein
MPSPSKFLLPRRPFDLGNTPSALSPQMNPEDLQGGAAAADPRWKVPHADELHDASPPPVPPAAQTPDRLRQMTSPRNVDPVESATQGNQKWGNEYRLQGGHPEEGHLHGQLEYDHSKGSDEPAEWGGGLEYRSHPEVKGTINNFDKEPHREEEDEQPKPERTSRSPKFQGVQKNR